MQSSCRGEEPAPHDIVYVSRFRCLSPIYFQFVDKLRIVASGGKGGDGCISLEGEHIEMCAPDRDRDPPSGCS